MKRKYVRGLSNYVTFHSDIGISYPIHGQLTNNSSLLVYFLIETSSNTLKFLRKGYASIGMEYTLIPPSVFMVREKTFGLLLRPEYRIHHQGIQSQVF